jgi:mRNA interferase MazF
MRLGPGAGCTSGAGWVITEKVRTVSANRFRRYAPELTLSADELNEVRHVLAQMLIV